MPRPWNAPRLLLIVAMIPWPSHLTAESGVTVRPSFTVAEVFDDNLFAAASAPAADTISRFTPGLGLDYLGRALTLRSRYAFDAEYFARHPELTDQQMRRRGSINLRFPGGGPWGILVDGAYFETHVPGELNTETGVLSGRARARRLSFGPALEYRSDGGTTVRSGYLLTKD